MLKRSLLASLVSLSGLIMGGCTDNDGGGSGSPGFSQKKPADLSLIDAGNDCVDLKDGLTTVSSWCGSYITSFDVERTFIDPKVRYVLLLVVDAELLPSNDYALWDSALNFRLVGTSGVDGLTFLVESRGDRLRCGGDQKILDCEPASG